MPEDNTAPENQNNPNTPENPVNQPPAQPTPQSPLVPTANPVNVPEQISEQKPEQVYVNPYTPKDSEPETGATYIETSVKHLSTELGVHADAFDAVLENALKHGDVSLINPQALGKELTPEQAVRVKQLATAAFQEVQSSVQRAQSEVFAIAGGEAQWNTSVQAFNANASEDEQGYAAYLAEKGKLKQAADYVLGHVQRGGYTNQQNKAPLQGGNGGISSGMSKAEYASEMSKIEREAGNRSLSSPEFNARLQDLNARRALGRQQGL